MAGNFRLIKKPWNGFFHPMNGMYSLVGQPYEIESELQTQIQIGSKLFPEYPMQSVSESFQQLCKTLGVLNSTQMSLDIDLVKYRTLHHIIAIDAEKTLQAGYTGLNTRMGDLLTVKVKPTGNLTAAKMPSSMQVVLHSDQILNISDSGVQVMD